ncbi:phosphomannomutase/phosphoglucomutase [Jeongeupia naejangsanensis]|uniref:Phosphomannomutase/phosphoglucomutase n=1 Tax=Jeongeupia naejangsanensis TaxID=613195 RepID=A0ABS2BHN4_9NEIS|nr:phosphomannomutase/phosphoglucomutase [Jeongeupia naejangsanensis]MBM3115132.1 phosphomannomutase/phosphoglucomutase [Jeongeupia naejangsanensis]
MASIPAQIFKAYDVRARVDLLTPEAAYLIGRALGTEASAQKHHKLVVGRDGRLSSPALSDALIRGLVDSGIDVLDLGLVATPMMYFAAIRHADGCGAIVTGSHNPPDYNGIKVMLGGGTVGGRALKGLYDRIVRDDFVDGGGQVIPLDVDAEYRSAIVASQPLARPLKVVVDCGNGVPGAFVPELYRALGCDVTELFCEVDGRFPHHHPDPQVEANVADLKRVVLEQRADVGLAFDGDGDRLGVVTPDGRFVPGDKLLMLFAAAELARQPGGHVLYDVKSTGALSGWIGAHGGSSEIIATGHTHMKQRMKETGALVAGELSGHFAFAGWGFDDGLYASVKLLQLIAGGQNLNEAFSALPTRLSTPELQLPVAGDGHDLVDRVATTATFPTATAVLRVDGLRIEYPDGFGLIRASNTTPVLTLRIEADHGDAMLRIRDELATALLPLPFPVFAI